MPSLKWVARISRHSIHFHGYLLFQIWPKSNKKVENGATSLMPWNKVFLSMCQFLWNLSFLNIFLQRMPKSHFTKIPLSSHNHVSLSLSLSLSHARTHTHTHTVSKWGVHFTSQQNLKCETHTCIRLTSGLLFFVGLNGNYIFHFIVIFCISSIFRNDPY